MEQKKDFCRDELFRNCGARAYAIAQAEGRHLETKYVRDLAYDSYEEEIRKHNDTIAKPTATPGELQERVLSLLKLSGPVGMCKTMLAEVSGLSFKEVEQHVDALLNQKKIADSGATNGFSFEDDPVIWCAI